MNMTQWLRGILLMPHSELRPRLVEPILKGIAHPHTALTEEELAQVRADLELAEPKTCTWRRRVFRKGQEENYICESQATVQRLMVCGEFDYRCDEHRTQIARRFLCRCGWVGERMADHVAVELSL